jgi:putative redox protein
MRIVTVSSGSQPYETSIATEKHSWTADEPIELGGTDSGPSPYELLLSAVGACIVITVQMYAGRKAWPLDSVKVELEFNRVHAADCSDCEKQRGFVSEISTRIALSGSLTEEQRGRILEIAGKCPVKRSLEGEVKFRAALSH